VRRPRGTQQLRHRPRLKPMLKRQSAMQTRLRLKPMRTPAVVRRLKQHELRLSNSKQPYEHSSSKL